MYEYIHAWMLVCMTVTWTHACLMHACMHLSMCVCFCLPSHSSVSCFFYLPSNSSVSCTLPSPSYLYGSSLSSIPPFVSPFSYFGQSGPFLLRLPLYLPSFTFCPLCFPTHNCLFFPYFLFLSTFSSYPSPILSFPSQSVTSFPSTCSEPLLERCLPSIIRN